MVRLNKIYTRGGDTGETSLGGGERRKKYDVRVATYGAVDEANAAIGLARLHADEANDLMLARIQNDLFDLGADFARPVTTDEKTGDALRITDAQVTRLEHEIDAMNVDLEPLNSFTLPGGTPLAAHLHLARTVIRRAERLAFQLADAEPINPPALKYCNRLSDHLFVLSRRANNQGKTDVLWIPGAHRE